MKQRWYKKSSIQAAIVTGIFVIAAAVISGLATHQTPSVYSPETSVYSPETSSSSTFSAGLEVADIIVILEKGGVRLIDFRVVNKSSSDVVVSRVRFKVIRVESEPLPALGYVEFSKVYDLDISDLENAGDQVECVVSQVIEPNRTDRFGIRLTAQDMGNEARRWVLEVILITSEGIIVSGPIEVELP
ncbi:MAG: hypothetical protein HXS41_00460 [Theionarchaea archaeon]|nr:hypothetical protein [Theionarchaea archaeon]MBU6999142.1 hypothetical protein [Theionarchaea archaeon]MBU7019503.1 hypothetical protein [Theionarchaea archaeon]MBU7034935.1 hypothetical protein [Theionarchaea archaeon]MBU7040783.1 hypothetical protein [Theionarchaea archaeon]